MNRRSTIVVACGISFLAGAAATWQQQGTTRREPQFENAQLRAWKSIILPNQPLTQHRHEHGRALIALTDGKLKVVDQHGKLITTYVWKAGKAYWLDKDPPGQTHADVNETGKTIEVIVVELQNDK